MTRLPLMTWLPMMVRPSRPSVTATLMAAPARREAARALSKRKVQAHHFSSGGLNLWWSHERAVRHERKHFDRISIGAGDQRGPTAGRTKIETTAAEEFEGLVAA